MTGRFAQRLLMVLFIGGCLLGSAPLFAQDTQQQDSTNSSADKSKQAAPSPTSEEPSQEEDKAAKAEDADKTQPTTTDEAKTDEAKADDAKKDEAEKNKEEARPVESPKLIQVPQDEATSTPPRPKVAAVFVFTNGNRVESDDYLITKDAVFINKNGQKTRYPINTVDRVATKTANEGRGVDIVFPRSKSEFNLDF